MSSTFALVASDFVPTGGMDVANLALASYLARHGHRVELVAHRIAPSLRGLSGLKFHRVLRPLGSNFLASPLLDRAGRRVAHEVLAHGGRALVNGGNCLIADVNWVHYVHAAFAAQARRDLRSVKRVLERRLALRQERK